MVADSDQNGLAGHLEKTLQQSNLENTQLNKTINSLLHRSVEYGRAGRVLGENPTDDGCQEYIGKVVSFYQKYHVVVTCLERRDQEAWIKTLAKIKMWANSYLKKQDIHGLLRAKSVEDCAQNAVLAFLTSVYHYDVEFDAWFCVLVQNVCRKYIKKQVSSSRDIEKEAVSIDELDYLLEKLADTNELDSRLRRELRAELLAAVKKLSSESRQQLIMFHYFSGVSFKEIASIMDKSMTAFYKLHFDALNDLKNNLGDDWF